MNAIRLDKYLADMGLGTRTQVKQMIRKGQVLVNETVCRKPEQKVDCSLDTVTANGSQVEYAAYEYYMLHKPQGYVSATEDHREKTVLELISEKKRRDLFPVGRLDKDTEGLLLITNDGNLSHRLLSPRKHVPKCYFARVNGRIHEDDVIAFEKGLDIGDERLTLPSQLKIMKAGEVSEIEVTVWEGRYHQVKRMFDSVHKPVIYLKRIQMGSLVLDPSLQLGSYRELTDKELERLQEYD